MISGSLEKKYYKIGEVCKAAGIKPHVLRYWEREIKSLRPDRSLKNQRLYTSDTLEKILKVKAMLDQGYKLEIVMKKIHEARTECAEDSLALLKNDLQRLKSLLDY